MVEQVEGRSCKSLRTLRSIDVANGDEGYGVAIRTCHIGSASKGAGVAAPDGPYPPTAFDDGPAPIIVHKRLQDIVIAANGDYAWSTSAATYPGSYDRQIFGSFASGLFVPAGNGQDTNLSITLSRTFSTLALTGDVLSWEPSFGGHDLWYQMPAPGSKVLPITVNTAEEKRPFTPTPSSD